VCVCVCVWGGVVHASAYLLPLNCQTQHLVNYHNTLYTGCLGVRHSADVRTVTACRKVIASCQSYKLPTI